MNRLFKGTVAGAAGVALLLGGAGTFALWNDAVNIGTDDPIVSGQLTFGTVPTGVWRLNGTTVDDIESVLIVPGDVLTYTVNGVEVVATGDYLHAAFGITTAGMTGDADLIAALDQTITVNGADPASVDITGTDTFDIVLQLEFDPETAGLTAQHESVDLSGVQLTVTQVPAPEHTA
jgi:alternate signal-mediated exported protein